MTLNYNQKRNIMALSVAVFMAVLYVALISIFIIQAHERVYDVMSLGAMMILVMTPIIAYILFDYITRALIHLIYLRTRRFEGEIEEKDPLMSWMAIIFSKED